MICQINRLVEYPITLPVINLGPPAFTSDCCSEGIIGFENSNSVLCTRVDSTCCLYGSYDNITSTTSSYVGNNYSDFLHDYGYGSYVDDTIRFANQTVPSSPWAPRIRFTRYCIYGPASGILALGGECINSAACDDCPTFVGQLYDQEILRTRTFSIYLEPDNSKSNCDSLSVVLIRPSSVEPFHFKLCTI
jgi:hypothetical protein